MARSRRPKLGQHFLAGEGYRRRIVEALPLRPDDVVIEIGPGRGAMTGLLAERARRVVAVELDASLASSLTEELRCDERITILQADILSTDLATLCRVHEAEKCFVFGNLPYYITSPIIHHLLNQANSIRGMALLVQREVAERLAASPGTRDYGYLTVLAQFHSRPRLSLAVPSGAFSPPPKVQSALVDFQMNPKFPEWPPERRDSFLQFVKRCFAQKRKNLTNNLASISSRQHIQEALARLSLRLSVRAEQLTLEQFAVLHTRLRQQP